MEVKEINEKRRRESIMDTLNCVDEGLSGYCHSELTLSDRLFYNLSFYLRNKTFSQQLASKEFTFHYEGNPLSDSDFCEIFIPRNMSI